MQPRQEPFDDRGAVEVNKHIDGQYVSVVSTKGGRQVQYLVSKPIGMRIAVTGRSTRGYQAFPLQDKEIYFVKDTWRTEAGAKREGLVCQDLHRAGVPSAPNIGYYADDHPPPSMNAWCTITQGPVSWFESTIWKEQPQPTTVLRIRSRLMSKPVGFGLGEHKDMKELLGFARDMFDTGVAAYEKCGMLHRDISTSTVMFVCDPKSRKQKGITIDLESSVKEHKPMCESPCKLSSAWQFTSWRLLTGDDNAPHRLDDDLESILWVIYWHLLVYYSYPSLSTQDLAAILQEVFGSSTQKATRMINGAKKLSYIGGKTLLLEGLTTYPDLRKWLLGYAVYLDNCSAARKWPELLEKIPSRETFRKETLDLVDKHPFSAAPKAPEWKGLRAYRALGTTPGFPVTLSASSIEGLTMRETPSHGTTPPPFEADQEATRTVD